MNKKKKKLFGNVFWIMICVGLVAAAIADQLTQPAELRTWHGEVFGIPYDFRIPTLERLKATFWNKETTLVLVPHAFGVGWSINFYPLVQLILPQEK